jgi:integrase
MARQAKGQVIERRWPSGVSYALRFLAYGARYYVTLGSAEEGWSRVKAEQELQNVLADVRRGIWIPPDRSKGREIATADNGPEPEPSFHRFASEWLQGRRGELRARTVEFYEWALSHHLLPYFAQWRLSEITIEAVDAYRRFKVAQAEARRRPLERQDAAPEERPPRPLSAGTINKTIDVLQAVLALAVEYGYIGSNPAAGKRRRLKPEPRRPVHLDTAEQIEALVDAAGELDRRANARTSGRRALVATLVLAGLRVSEACGLCWRDVDLANGRIHVGNSKTAAGLREIPLLALLRDELAYHKAAAKGIEPNDPVFPSASGRPRNKDNVRKRVVEPVAHRADELLRERGQSPLPHGLTPHKLRHTFASVLIACGEDPASVMAQLGHSDPKFTLRTYTHLMRRAPAERARLEALVAGEPLTGSRRLKRQAPGAAIGSAGGSGPA